MNTEALTEKTLAAMFDHTQLAPDATEEMMKKLCDEAREIGTAMVAINPYWVPFCKEQLKGTDVHVGAAIGFPLGQNTLATKLFETRDSLEEGADEIDYMINQSKVKAGDWDYIEKEMREITEISHEFNAPCKVIFENCNLTKDEIRKIAEIAKKVGIDYVKTSTGKGKGGATVEDVKLMKDTVGDTCKVKAAGGIRDWETCRAMIEAGAERIGTSASLKILEEFRRSREQ
ncbi:deoxyribose-phosphate aldolase [Faecalibaculum rodentium]|jgi:deoxyribose-phosphate aldolase|uniref:Deoxyribose-phosphate aldolase n=3 Tax=Faecalibaculum rodentium TaxID=1702221 RepID=A0A140DVT8_9FIRM|nr:deoxyribose-phosphate aldolase [Faecalibaculum rodentium]AMK54765.1 deoxyribose-phosphate aldolase [Faecalibaculum rodentium]